MFELDHVFICSNKSAIEAGHLANFGLTEGTPNTHPGAGTACRRFFFRNAMLELIWVHDVVEAGGAAHRPTYLLERWRKRSSGSSPFGICLRPNQPSRQAAPFLAHEYRPPYLPEPLFIHIAHNASNIVEPLLFYLNFAQRPDTVDIAQPLEHPSGFQEITGLRVISPASDPISAEISDLESLGLVTFLFGDEHRIEIEFDTIAQNTTIDFRPHLPLIFHW